MTTDSTSNVGQKAPQRNTDPAARAADDRLSIRMDANLWLAVAALVISLLAAGAAVFAWYQAAVTTRLEAGDQRGAVQRLSTDFEELKQSRTEVADQLEALRTRMTSLEQETQRSMQDEARERDASIAGFRSEFNELSASVERVYDDLGRSVDTWFLEETEQLLLLANQRLTLARDAALASTALRLADAKLEEIGDPALLPIRRQIAEELAALGALPSVDTSGAALRLSAAMENIESLPLAEDMQGPEWQSGDAVSPEPPADGEGVEHFARQVLADLGNLVRVRRVDETRMPKFTPVHRFLIHENLRLNLAAAQFALLRDDVVVYQTTLEAAREWTQRYFDSSAEPVTRVVDDLNQLAALPLDQELPSINRSLELLRDAITERKAR
jgi:uroporphyrin-III C-methyltransferase